MKTNNYKIAFFLLISLSIVQTSIGQNIKYDKKYYDGYLVTSENPNKKSIEANKKIVCKVKNINYTYFSGSQTSGQSYVSYMTDDGKKERLWWWSIAEIKTDSFYYKHFKFTFVNSEDVLARRICEGNINFFINPRIDFFEINDSIIKLPFSDGNFIPNWQYSKKKVEDAKIEYKKFMTNLVKEDSELVTKINNDDNYVNLSNIIIGYDRVYPITKKIISEYNEWYKKNH